MPIRYGVIKRYFDKHKYQKSKREALLATIDESEEFVKGLLGDEYVCYTVAIPEIGEFMQGIKAKELVKAEEASAREGQMTTIELLDAKLLKQQ